jgi:hypothetical protein
MRVMQCHARAIAIETVESAESAGVVGVDVCHKLAPS